MKTLLRIFLIAGIISPLVFLTSCVCIEGNGELVTENRFETGFSKISLGISANMYIKQDTAYSITIEAPENLIDMIYSKIQGKTLKIGFDQMCYNTERPVKIYVSLPDITGISLSGSGNVYSEGSLSAKNLDIRVSGSGKIDLYVIANKIDTDISGSGSIILDGSTKKLSIDISGSGNVTADDMTAYDCYVDINGSGYAKVTVHDLLHADISGSGSVYYSGNPELKTHVSGSGSVTKR